MKSEVTTTTGLGFILMLIVGNFAASAADNPSSQSQPIFASDAKLERLWNDGEFTEGVAVGPDGRIYFSDIARTDRPGKIMRFDPKSGTTDVFCSDSGQSNGLMFDRSGTLIACCGANGGKIALCQIQEDGNVQPLVSKFDGKRFNSPNDLVIHPDGSIFFSDPRYVGPEKLELDHMSVFRLNPETKQLTRLKTGISKPNGVVLSPDGKTLYVAETDNGSTGQSEDHEPASPPRMTFNAFDLREDGTVTNRRVLRDFGDQTGIDGMTVDANGNVFAAVRSEDRFGIAVFSPEGEELEFLPTPELPTNCCFGIDEDQTSLYITVGTGLYRVSTSTTGFHPATTTID
ncbi:Gluconolactonase precursor [Thalassoglobus neptunius]|uniref:Gluconolactonase n=1 Tax=Thalassoglobus neptunius TaxID=1938619 RepID=A0A5C5X724_9PLAN|nr:SMP-30/gluconolactonase/LRE family protein [Thalassoglobus neptunius]TWT58459.1 Gluconolactonase precursor [Thalassoglobus neptunius]